jgi:hypothetical protein
VFNFHTIKEIDCCSLIMYTVSIDVGTKNLAYVIFNRDLRIVEWEVVDISKKPTSGLIAYLQSLFVNDTYNADTIDTVLIEKQPNRNVKMRVVENTLTIFFHMSGMRKILNYSAKNKLGELGKTIKGAKNYSVRKKYGIFMCLSFLKSKDPDKLPHFEGHKKKDDLADCLLQGISYVNANLIGELSKCILVI